MQKTELAWMAGLFIGEGNVQLILQRSAKHPGAQWAYPALHLSMCDRRSVTRFARGVEEIIGGGYSCGIYINTTKRAPHHKRQWRISLSGSPARKVCNALMPFMRRTDKGDQYQAVLDGIKREHRPVSACPKGHPRTSEHYRRNNRGWLYCHTCKIEGNRRRRERKKVQ